MSLIAQLPPVSRDVVAEGGEGVQSGATWRMILDVFLENRLATLGLGVIVFMLLFCFFGPLLYHTQQVYNNPNIATSHPA